MIWENGFALHGDTERPIASKKRLFPAERRE
jgi:hypothetical protein